MSEVVDKAVEAIKKIVDDVFSDKAVSQLGTRQRLRWIRKEIEQHIDECLDALID